MSVTPCTCLHCGRTFSAPDSVLGKKVRCPGCREAIVAQQTPASVDVEAVNSPDDFSFAREDEAPEDARPRARRAVRGGNVGRIILWLIFLLIVVGVEMVRAATGLMNIYQNTSLTSGQKEDMAVGAFAFGWVTLFFIFFAIDRIISSGEG